MAVTPVVTAAYNYLGTNNVDADIKAILPQLPYLSEDDASGPVVEAERDLLLRSAAEMRLKGDEAGAKAIEDLVPKNATTYGQIRKGVSKYEDLMHLQKPDHHAAIDGQTGNEVWASLLGAKDISQFPYGKATGSGNSAELAGRLDALATKAGLPPLTAPTTPAANPDRFRQPATERGAVINTPAAGTQVTATPSDQAQKMTWADLQKLPRGSQGPILDEGKKLALAKPLTTSADITEMLGALTKRGVTIPTAIPQGMTLYQAVAAANADKLTVVEYLQLKDAKLGQAAGPEVPAPGQKPRSYGAQEPGVPAPGAPSTGVPEGYDPEKSTSEDLEWLGKGDPQGATALIKAAHDAAKKRPFNAQQAAQWAAAAGLDPKTATMAALAKSDKTATFDLADLMRLRDAISSGVIGEGGGRVDASTVAKFAAENTSAARLKALTAFGTSMGVGRVAFGPPQGQPVNTMKPGQIVSEQSVKDFFWIADGQDPKNARGVPLNGDMLGVTVQKGDGSWVFVGNLPSAALTNDEMYANAKAEISWTATGYATNPNLVLGKGPNRQQPQAGSLNWGETPRGGGFKDLGFRGMGR